MIRWFVHVWIGVWFLSQPVGAQVPEYQIIDPHFAYAPYRQVMTVFDFEDLLSRLVSRVDIMRPILNVDPSAELFGQAAQDLSFWLLEKIMTVKSKHDWERLRSELLSLSVIPIRDFTSYRNKIQVVSDYVNFPKYMVSPLDFGMSDIEYIGRAQFRFGENEYHASMKPGFLPVDRIRIGAYGVQQSAGSASGVKEIFWHHYTVAMPSEFDLSQKESRLQTQRSVSLAIRLFMIFARDRKLRFGINEPLARYDIDRLFPSYELADIRKVILDLTHQGLVADNSRELRHAVKDAILTHPTMIGLMFDHFGISRLISAHRQLFDFEMNYLRARPQSFAAVDGVEPINQNLLFFNAKNFPRFSTVIHRNIIPTGETSSVGVLALDSDSVERMKSADRSATDFMVKLHISRRARLLDTTQGEGQHSFSEFKSSRSHLTDEDVLREFATFSGADILKINVSSQMTYLILNAAVVDAMEGVAARPLAPQQILGMAQAVQSADDLRVLIVNLALNPFRNRVTALGAMASTPNADRFGHVLSELLDAEMDAKNAVWFLSRVVGGKMSVAQAIYYLASKDIVKTLAALKKMGILGSKQLTGVIPLLKRFFEQSPTSAPSNDDDDDDDPADTPDAKKDTPARSDQLIEILSSEGLSASEILDGLSLIANFETRNLLKSLLPLATTAKEVVYLLQESSSEIQLSALRTLESPVFERFFGLAPTPADTRTLLALFTNNVPLLLKIWERTFRSVQTAAEFLDLTYLPERMDPLTANRINSFFLSQIDFFLSLRPSAPQVKQFQMTCLTSLHDSIKLIRSVLGKVDHVSGATEYLELVATPPRAQRAERLGLDELVRETHKIHTRQWTVADYRTLIEQSVATPDTLVEVWLTASRSFLRNRNIRDREEKAAQMVELLRVTPNMDPALYASALDTFLTTYAQELARFQFDSDTFRSLLNIKQITPEGARIVFENWMEWHPGLMEIPIVLPIIESAPVGVRLGFQNYLKDHTEVVLSSEQKVPDLLNLLSKTQPSEEVILQMAIRILDDRKVLPSEVFELLQEVVKRDATIDVVDLFRDRFTMFSTETINKVLGMRLALRNRAYVLVLSFYSDGSRSDTWMQRLQSEIAGNPALATEIYRMKSFRKSKLLSDIPNSVLGVSAYRGILDQCKGLLFKGVRR